MTVPVLVLSAGSALVGFLAVPHFLGGHDVFGHFVGATVPAWARAAAPEHGGLAIAVEWALSLLAVLVGAAGIAAAWVAFVRRPGLAADVAGRWPRLHRALTARLGVDEAYVRWIVDPLRRLAGRGLHRGVDVGLIEGIVNGVGRLFRRVGGWLALTQGGLVRGYVAWMIVGTLLLLLTMLGSN